MTSWEQGDILAFGMFTKKPDRDLGGDAFQRSAERPVSETETFTDRPLAAAKRPSAGKLVPSIIGEDLSIVGNVSSKGEIQVDGQIQGDISCGSLLLGDKSQISGAVVAEDVVVRGRVLGSIRGLRVTLQSQSHVEGDIYHQSLAIEQGAFFEGKSRRSDDPMAASKGAGESASATGDGAAMGMRPDTPVRAAE
jgi:cytoskeletal protein CcmA (bactofilin family)